MATVKAKFKRGDLVRYKAESSMYKHHNGAIGIITGRSFGAGEVRPSGEMGGYADQNLRGYEVNWIIDMGLVPGSQSLESFDSVYREDLLVKIGRAKLSIENK